MPTRKAANRPQPVPLPGDDAPLFGQIVRQASDAILVVDADRRLVLFNCGAAALFG